MLREILSELDNNMSDEELDQMIDEIDADGSGTVDFDGVLITEKFRNFFFLNYTIQQYNDARAANTSNYRSYNF